jgi:peptidoglycan/xylan/chitin deacetylase (PgdA/CDA1 family)
MIETAILLALVSTLTAAGAYLWRRAAGPATHGVLRLLTVALAAVLLVGAGTYALMNARRFQICGEIVPRVDTTQPVVALTFDDGPVPPYTEELLRVLAEKDVKATFFVTGQNLEKHPALAARVAEQGHELGNHSYSHPRMVLMSYGSIRDELERTDLLIRRAGYTGTIHFRSPYAKKLFMLPLYLWRAGKRNIIADVEPDAEPKATAAPMVETALTHTTPGSIIILHAENRYRTESLKAVPGIIDALHQKGYRFVTVSELLARR